MYTLQVDYDREINFSFIHIQIKLVKELRKKLTGGMCKITNRSIRTYFEQKQEADEYCNIYENFESQLEIINNLFLLKQKTSLTLYCYNLVSNTLKINHRITRWHTLTTIIQTYNYPLLSNHVQKIQIMFLYEAMFKIAESKNAKWFIKEEKFYIVPFSF